MRMTRTSGSQPFESSSEEVAAEIRHWIGSGRIRPGEPLAIAHVAAELRVSLQPVREAFRVLELEGRLHKANNRVATVRSLSKAELEDIYRLRDLIEDEAMRESLKRLVPSDIAELVDHARCFDLAVIAGDGDAARLANREFFSVLRSRNPLRRLAEMTNDLRALSAPYRSKLFLNQESWPILDRLHQEVVDAIERGNHEAAITAARRMRRLTLESFVDTETSS
jgi:DNA-binding GntR family transcriptional regulator